MSSALDSFSYLLFLAMTCLAAPKRPAGILCSTATAVCRSNSYGKQMNENQTLWQTMLLLLLSALPVSAQKPPVQQSPTGITHSFLATGGETYIMSGDGKITWRFPGPSRDGWVLANGHVLLAAAKSTDYPSGAILELDKEGKILFEFKGSQSEVDAVEPLKDGHILLTESGPAPHLWEIDREQKILVKFHLECQTRNFHMQTRMARKLPNGNYLVPHLLDKVVREYRPDGSVASATKTPDDPKESWPFTAI